MNRATAAEARAVLDLAYELFGVETRSFREAVYQAAERTAARAGCGAGALAEIAMQALREEHGAAGEVRS